MTYKTGDKVSHPGHGACVIKDICEREFGDFSMMYYVLHSMVENQTAIYVPVEKADQLGVRHLITEDEADVLIGSLHNTTEAWIPDRVKRQKKLENLFVDNSKASLLSSMSALSLIVTRRSEKPLGSFEKGMLKTIRNRTLSEIALAKGLSLEDVIERTEEIILERSACLGEAN